MAQRESDSAPGNTDSSGVAEATRTGATVPPALRPYVTENKILNRLPNHLKQYIVDQNYEKYTPIDHAVWRYVMRLNCHYLSDHAHESYMSGLRQTGIDVNRIPSIEGMNRLMSKIGWAAVTVDGFIPPAAFMEYQAYNVLVIAADMRQINHIEYTPAPDIIHEAAGHSPIISEPEYAAYLRRFGEVGCKAMSSKQDFQLYEAIRHLSILKEMPNADPKEVKESEEAVEYVQEHLGEPSEMGRLSRMHWWTVEYGLIGELNKPRLYGAGLLSSIGEAQSCLSDDVKKIAYGLEAAEYAFDITIRQPQLFVTPSFAHLIEVLETFYESMAVSIGGGEGLAKAIACENTSTCVYSSGLQVSGTFVETLTHETNNNPIYLRTSGPTNLAFDAKELPGHSKDYHRDGFGSPIGRLKGNDQPLETMSDDEFRQTGINSAGQTTLCFEGGVTVTGVVESITRMLGKIVLTTFIDCKVTLNERVLFDPSWGKYDMAVGANIVSVFSGAADKDAYDQVSLVPNERTIKVKYDQTTLRLQELYGQIRKCREDKAAGAIMPQVWEELKTDHPSDWLLPVEIYELLKNNDLYPEQKLDIGQYLEKMSGTREEYRHLISRGLALIN